MHNEMWKVMVLVFSTLRFSSSECSENKYNVLFDKIVGGRSAADGEFPFQASLQKFSPLGYYHTCGAVLISPNWLLTAAHCIHGNSANVYRIMLGSNYLRNPPLAENIYSVTMIVIKQGFDPENYNNDIALIQITPPARQFVDCVCLSDSSPDDNITGIIVGWGATNDENDGLDFQVRGQGYDNSMAAVLKGGRASNILQAAEVQIISRYECLQYYSFLTKSMICAGYVDGGIDACQGDSGGPLLQYRNGSAYLVGIVSWGIGCAEAGHPGVYTDVTQFVPWIKHYVYPEL